MFLKHTLVIFLIAISLWAAKAQQAVTTFGLQFKPILSSELINTGPQFEQSGDIGFEISPRGGYSFGMVIRKGFNDQFSLETGINFTRRNYGLRITEDSTGFVGNSDFRYIIYEIPILGLIYIQLGNNTYMSTAFGASLNFLPSDWESYDDYFIHYSQRESWIVPSLLANVGFEYRTYESGYWYLGFSLHRPFMNLTEAGVGFTERDYTRQVKESAFFGISGNYLTIDLRYFFHEPPERNKKQRIQ